MGRKLSIAEVFDAQRATLALAHVCGDMNRNIGTPHDDVSPADIVGHLNIIHPERIQVFGTPEHSWSMGQPSEKFRYQIREIVGSHCPALIVADGCEVDSILREECEAANTPLLTSPEASVKVIDILRTYLYRIFAETTTLHGVFMDVLGLGVLLTGDSGVGKSELALELVSRGHGLVADDVVELARIAPTTIEGRCPGMLRDYLEVRGLGLLNIRTIFGETAARRKMKLKLIVHLQKHAFGDHAPRLPFDSQSQEILGIPIRKVIFHVAPGRNLAVLLEAAVRNCILQLRGIDSMSEFITRQQQAVLDGDI